MGHPSLDRIIELQKNPANIRNLCILAHVDHGQFIPWPFHSFQLEFDNGNNTNECNAILKTRFTPNQE